jgi:transaldolase
MLEAFARDYAATGCEQPIMVIARYVSHGIIRRHKKLTVNNIYSHLQPEEVMAMAELGCPHITISAANLKALQEMPDDLPPPARKPKSRYAEYATAKRLTALSTVDPLAGPAWDGKLATMETDYVSDGGARLDAFIAQDPSVSRRFEDARKFFLAAEETARVAIDAEMKAQGYIVG